MKKLMTLAVGCWMLVVGAGTAFGGLIDRPEKVSVDYLRWDAQKRVLETATASDCTVVTADTKLLEGGAWYAVTNEVVLGLHGLVVNDSAHLILCDEAKLVITNVQLEDGLYDMPAICVPEGGRLRSTDRRRGAESLMRRGHSAARVSAATGC